MKSHFDEPPAERQLVRAIGSLGGLHLGLNPLGRHEHPFVVVVCRLTHNQRRARAVATDACHLTRNQRARGIAAEAPSLTCEHPSSRGAAIAYARCEPVQARARRGQLEHLELHPGALLASRYDDRRISGPFHIFAEPSDGVGSCLALQRLVRRRRRVLVRADPLIQPAQHPEIMQQVQRRALFGCGLPPRQCHLAARVKSQFVNGLRRRHSGSCILGSLSGGRWCHGRCSRWRCGRRRRSHSRRHRRRCHSRRRPRTLSNDLRSRAHSRRSSSGSARSAFHGVAVSEDAHHMPRGIGDLD